MARGVIRQIETKKTKQGKDYLVVDIAPDGKMPDFDMRAKGRKVGELVEYLFETRGKYKNLTMCALYVPAGAQKPPFEIGSTEYPIERAVADAVKAVESIPVEKVDAVALVATTIYKFKNWKAEKPAWRAS